MTSRKFVFSRPFHRPAEYNAELNFIPPLVSARRKQVASKIFAYALAVS